MQKAIKRFAIDSRGSALIEYSLLAGSIAIVLLSAITTLSNELAVMYQTIISGIASIAAG